MSRPRALDQLVEELCRLPGIGEIFYLAFA